ncbi:MAG: ABC transporter permease [Lachnospiraceae bacterium]|nr:ABC transporter permease [Lachnospiraceae bacterium]
MRFSDILLMSISNLWKRKLRTALTVLGVVIGITSIVVMVALGNGLKESMLENYANYSSMTQIEVYSGGYYSIDSGEDEVRLDKSLINQLLAMEHVESVYPHLSFNVLAKTGQYMGYLNVLGMSQEELLGLDLELSRGSIPDSQTELSFLFGQSVLTDFYVEKTGKYVYWETNEVPDIDLMNDTIFYIFDTDAYWNAQGGSSEDGSAVKQPKKYLIDVSGVMAGDIDDWSNYSGYVLCDIDALEAKLKQIFRKEVIPGQPARKNGKAYDEIFYSEIIVQVDDMENVTDLTKLIQDMGYNAYSSAEWIQQEMDSMNTIQAVLGAIGAVAMLVAAISITNTMMMSIYERTKEIGVMKVLGCDIRNIQALFLMEAGFIGFIGGVAGVGFSYLLSFVINTLVASGDLGASMGISGAICRIPLWLSPLAVIFAIVIGMAAGFIPSLRAMRLSPLAAIRNE